MLTVGLVYFITYGVLIAVGLAIWNVMVWLGYKIDKWGRSKS